MIDKDFNSREAFNEVIDNLEIIAHLTDYGKKLIKQGVIDLRIENLKYKENWDELREWLKDYEEGSYGLGSYETGLSDGLRDVIKKMQELEQGSDGNGNN